jgi:hypothetical protein
MNKEKKDDEKKWEMGRNGAKKTILKIRGKKTDKIKERE